VGGGRSKIPTGVWRSITPACAGHSGTLIPSNKWRVATSLSTEDHAAKHRTIKPTNVVQLATIVWCDGEMVKSGPVRLMSAVAPKAAEKRKSRHVTVGPQKRMSHSVLSPAYGPALISSRSDRAYLVKSCNAPRCRNPAHTAIELFSSCHARLGSGRQYCCTILAKIEVQPRPNAAN
jgi:hypothetical protein